MKVLYNLLIKTPTRTYVKRAIISSKTRGEATSSTTHSNTSESSGKRRKRFVDNPKDISKLTCLIYSPGHYSDKCKVLDDFGAKYAKDRTTKNHTHDPATNKKFVRQQEKNYVIQHAFDEIILQENEKLSVKDETHENIDDEFDEDEMYKLENES